MSKMRRLSLLTVFLSVTACSVLVSAADAGASGVSDGASVSTPTTVEATTETQVRPRWGIKVGRGMLFEKTNSAKADTTRFSFLTSADLEWKLASTALGLGLEYSRFGSSDGNQTIQVSNLNESLLAWTDLNFAREGIFIPYFGIGLGVSRLTVETQLSGLTEKSTGLWLPVGAARVGVLAAWNSALRFRADVRFETAQELKTNDARLGVAVSLQYLFGRMN